MHDEQTGNSPALTELRRQLADGLARSGRNVTQLASRAGLGRTTVSEALSSAKPLPSKATVAALARALNLPVQELLALQRTAAGESGSVPTGGPGRPIGEWDPHQLEVHPAGPDRAASDSAAVRVLPGYVTREHDRVLADAVGKAAAGRSGIVVLVGTSSTGKTRACWEAVQPLADQGWRLWHPFDPTRAQAALEDLHRVGPRTVVWLNEAQHYLGDRAVGEEIAAAVHHLLVSRERGPVLVLGTLWPEYAHQYTVLPVPGEGDPHSLVRELLSGHTLAVPDAFDAQALAAATAVAEGGDRMLADALTRARTDGRVAQDLAGAPELLNRYQYAGPAAKALLEAAMDARRLGVGLHLPQAFLIDAATDYFSDTGYDQLTEDWAEQAFAGLAQLVHGKQAPLRRTTPRGPRRPPPSIVADRPAAPPAGPVFRLADYLEQHGRTTRRLLCPPDSFWHAAHTHLTHPDDLHNLSSAARSRHRLQWAHHLSHRAADHGSTDALRLLAGQLRMDGNGEEAERLLRQAADHGGIDALYDLAVMRDEAGDREGAELLLRQAADSGSINAMSRLALRLESKGDREGAASLAQEAAGHGSTDVLYLLAVMREARRREEAKRLLQQAADHGNARALHRLARRRERAGDREGAERLLQQAADHGDDDALYFLARRREEAGDKEEAERLLQQAADHGNIAALSDLALVREAAGDPEGADTLALKAAGHNTDDDALYRLIRMREEAGDREGAERLLRQAVDQGSISESLETLWPYGLDPDGTPTPPWQPSEYAPLDQDEPPTP
ncbi:hypothetical protein ACFZB2_39550 [Streptomyces bobili]|uniref:hypothetical protein n=1 Tax=Streptomyces bobili TaxID=67280 RepID=UPI0036E496C8